MINNVCLAKETDSIITRQAQKCVIFPCFLIFPAILTTFFISSASTFSPFTNICFFFSQSWKWWSKVLPPPAEFCGSVYISLMQQWLKPHAESALCFSSRGHNSHSAVLLPVWLTSYSFINGEHDLSLSWLCWVLIRSSVLRIPLSHWSFLFFFSP